MKENLRIKLLPLFQFSDAKRNIRLAEATLFTIMEFSSWIKFGYLLADNKALFQILFWLLEVEELRYHAAECLDTIFQRKVSDSNQVLFLIKAFEVKFTIIVRKGVPASSFLRHSPLDPTCPPFLNLCFPFPLLCSTSFNVILDSSPHPQATPSCPNPTNQPSLV